MQVKKIMSDLDYLCDFVLKSNSYNDFGTRFNFMLSMVVNTFQEEIDRRKQLPFFSFVLINEMNDKLNSLVARINENENPFSEGVLMDNIFLLILQEDFPQYYEIYLYHAHYINN